MKLIKIVSNVQNIADAIASVIKVDVTIVDNHLNRIAATGRYKKNIGEKVNKNSVFGFAFRRGESFIIENPRNHIACLKCEDIQKCREYAEVCCPIKVNNQTIGVIGLIAFEEGQRQAIISNKTNLMEFLNRMADLIASKLLEQEKTEKIKLLATELEIVLNSVDRGIIAVDEEGDFLHYNKKAVQLFKIDEKKDLPSNIKDLLGNLNLSHLILKNESIKNRAFRYERKNYHFRGIFDADPIVIGDKSFGIVFTFSNISEVLSVVNDIATGTIMMRFDHIIGNSQCLKDVKDEAQKAAKTTSTVLIQGESGTGKELFARAIHFHGKRMNRPFIPINCAAIPEQLLESELFGYEEGAFTGSKRGGKAGKFELANKGTIFLDEIGDMPIHLQTKLLRVLQAYEIEKVGGKELIPIDVRIIAATNKDLEKKVVEGEFREDLFYRLNVIPINIPPLRERKEDVVILVKYLLDKCNKKLGKHIEQIDTHVVETLINYGWPGNVRELENTVEYAVNMCSSNIITKMDLPNRLIYKNQSVEKIQLKEITPIKTLEIREIKKAIAYLGNTKQAMTKAAQTLGISRATLYRKLKEYQIKQS
ncbi:sigma-54-dependent Fis family transcriptional regulator [Marinisporobacter balticus]|uniref:Transcriptional regulator with PAS, ATPase and Fis domain n=1 Tax=Marinisporobacter balticus TaxID=2018667 RepID=A0A4R2KS71_9FIRM|nr:sigma 54-interacting transcriptional regulator [Marinisporobacter balticus]TCO73839.1 transcriptional regulator with PAS, ATPase and Fis domain [Marinisporobacter balticus]